MYSENPSFPSFLASITRLSDWHCQQIRQLCPLWSDFCSFLASFGDLREGLSCEEIDALLDQIYPQWDADPEYDDEGNITGYYQKFIDRYGWKAVTQEYS